MSDQELVNFWGREPDFICHQNDDEVPHIDVYRFPSVQDNSCAMSYRNVYMTRGMSEMAMKVPEDLRDEVVSRIELTAYSKDIIWMENQSMDFISSVLHWMAHFPFREDTYFSYFQTFQVGHPIVDGSEMSAYLFAQTPIVDADALFERFPSTEGFIHLVPISEPERLLVINEGVQRLFELFDKHGVNPDFDLYRKSII